MTDREWHSKEGKVVRKSPRCGMKKFNRPFTAPRRVVEDIVESEVQENAREDNKRAVQMMKTTDQYTRQSDQCMGLLLILIQKG
jgi:hypothetical protein